VPGHRDVAPAQGGESDRATSVGYLAEPLAPAGQVVGDGPEGQPSGIGPEAPRGHVRPRAFFQVLDHELYFGVTLTLGLSGNGSVAETILGSFRGQLTEAFVAYRDWLEARPESEGARPVARYQRSSGVMTGRAKRGRRADRQGDRQKSLQLVTFTVQQTLQRCRWAGTVLVSTRSQDLVFLPTSQRWFVWKIAGLSGLVVW
jgi:hypothetical protein